ncbi:minor capsid protein [Gorillibacterium sp. sgz500922]|uniref:minor capsid protein n=1 Tax=Gorillibacterium sp. sgz500922 TaxID=3446694 RepID=UPI003F664417
MLKIGEVCELVSALVTDMPFVINDFSPEDPDDCGYCRLMPGREPSRTTPRAYPGLLIVIRSPGMSAAESASNSLFASLRNQTEFACGQTRVIACEADQSAPCYIGKDEAGRALYSQQFTLTLL